VFQLVGSSAFSLPCYSPSLFVTKRTREVPQPFHAFLVRFSATLSDEPEVELALV
jgi:hypothetical protein